MSYTKLDQSPEVLLTQLCDEHEVCSKCWTSHCKWTPKVLWFCTYSSFTYFIHSSVHYLFLHVFNKTKPWLTQCGGELRYLGENVWWYTLGATITPFIKGVVRASASASPLRVTTSTQLTRHMHTLSSQNKSWHHQSIMWWCPSDVRDFGWWQLNQS